MGAGQLHVAAAEEDLVHARRREPAPSSPVEERALRLAARRTGWKATCRARPGRASASTAGSSAFTTAQSLAVWLREDPGLGLRVLLEAGVAVEVVGGEVQEDRHLRAEGVGALELEARDLEHEGRVRRSSPPRAR